MRDWKLPGRPGWKKGLGAVLVLLLAAGGAAVLMAGDRTGNRKSLSPELPVEKAGVTCPRGQTTSTPKENSLMDTASREGALRTAVPPIDADVTKETATATFALG
jgi:hypothetical protein